LSHGPVQIDAHRFLTGKLDLRKVPGRIGFQFFQKNTIPGYFGFNVAVGAAADPQPDGAGGAMARQADDAGVQAKIFSAELGADSQLTGNF
jgi:hypothetical protein